MLFITFLVPKAPPLFIIFIRVAQAQIPFASSSFDLLQNRAVKHKPPDRAYSLKIVVSYFVAQDTMRAPVVSFIPKGNPSDSLWY